MHSPGYIMPTLQYQSSGQHVSRNDSIISEVYPTLLQRSNMERFVIVSKLYILCVCGSPGYAFEICFSKLNDQFINASRSLQTIYQILKDNFLIKKNEPKKKSETVSRQSGQFSQKSLRQMTLNFRPAFFYGSMTDVSYH